MKKYLITICLAVVTLLDHTPVSAQKDEKPLYTAALGIQAYTFRKSFPVDFEGTLDMIKSMGFTEIEGGGGRGVTPEEFRKMCAERGISIPATGTSYEILVEDPQSVVNNAKILGAKFVMCAWIPHENGKFNIDNARKAVEDFNIAGKILKEQGITLCYHVHGYEFWPYEDGTLLDYIIKNTNPEYVSLEMDVFWVQFGGGNPVELLEKYGDRWKLMHLKDMRKGAKKDLTGGTGPENDVVLGTGELDFPGILRAAKKAGIAHYFIEDESDSPAESVPQSIAYLKSLKE